MTTNTDPETTEHEAIHTWFGLTYSNYLVLPRTLLQSMPDLWQAKFVALLEEMQRAFAHVDQAEAYKVEAATEHELGGLTFREMSSLGISERETQCTLDHDHGWGFDCDTAYVYDSAGEADMPGDRLVLLPCKDPVPHYNRGRTRIEPRITP
jgi:hypothetical protein